MTINSDLSAGNIKAFPGADAPNQLMQIKEQAATYLVRMDSDECSAEERQQISYWLAANPQHQAALLKLAQQWDSMAVLADLAELFPLPEKEKGYAADNATHVASKEDVVRVGWLAWLGFNSQGKPSAWSLPGVAMASVFAVALAVVALPSVRTFISASPSINYITAVGERATYTLEDGSVVTLNTNSELAIRFNNSRRSIDLLRGEANFEVAKNTERPFVVYAGEGMVWAVGTAFNVRYRPGALHAKAVSVGQVNVGVVDIIVTEGTVKVFADIEQQAALPELNVDPAELKQHASYQASTVDHLTNNQQSLLTAGQRLRYSEVIEAKEAVGSLQLERQLAWHNGVIIFDGETLESALNEVARYTNKQLVIVDDSIRFIRIGGHYKTSDLDGFLAALTSSFGVHVESVGGNRLFLSAQVSL